MEEASMMSDQSYSQIGQSIGSKLRAARIAKKLTQSQLASPDFSVSYISAIERGQIHPSLRALEVLAGRLGFSSAQFLPGHDDHSIFLSPMARDEEEVELAFSEAQILIRQSAVLQAIAQLEKLAAKNLKRQHQMQLRYLLGWAYLQTARLQECEHTLSEAERLAENLNDPYTSLQVLNLLGIAYATMDNHTQAMLSHESCLKLLESTQPKDPFFIAQVYTHMGQHHTHLNNLEQAIEMFQNAISISEELAAPHQLQSTYWTICQGYASAKEHRLATLYSHKCLHLHSQQSRIPLRSEIYHYLGRAMLKGDQEKARAYLDEALQQPGVLQDQLALASVTIHLAAWFLASKALEEAEVHAQKAHEMATPSGDTIIVADALLLLGHIRYAQKLYTEGDAHFVAGLEMLKRLGMHEELADQSARYAHLLEERGEPLKALIYMRLAFESSQKLNQYRQE